MSRDVHEPCGYVYGSDGCQAQCGEPEYPIDPAKLRRELREARLTIAAIVTQHGESLGDGRYRLVVDPEHLETAEARHLSVMEEPNSGVMLLRVRPL